MIMKFNPYYNCKNYCENYCQKCCNNFIYNNGNLYLEVINYTHKMVYFILQYTSESSQTITLTSPIFRFNHSEKILFEATARNICYNVLISTKPHPIFICNGTLGHAKTTRVSVEEMASGQIGCKILS